MSPMKKSENIDIFLLKFPKNWEKKLFISFQMACHWRNSGGAQRAFCDLETQKTEESANKVSIVADRNKANYQELFIGNI